MKKRILQIIKKAQDNDRTSRTFDNIIMIIIAINVVAIILESYDNLADSYGGTFRLIEIISVIIFTIEYLLRLWTADIKYPNYGGFKSRLKHAISFMAVIDLLAILPFYLPFLIPIDLRFLRILRLTRVLRVFKLHRYSKALNTISAVLKDKKEELLTTVIIMLFIIVISSTLIFYVEHDIQPKSFPNIVASFWWSISTLTKIGYGEIYPVTLLGKILASVISLLGIGLIAIPTGIISSGFISNLKKNMED